VVSYQKKDLYLDAVHRDKGLANQDPPTNGTGLLETDVLTNTVVKATPL
jgi:hypothetical protein